ncbi:hypothetical protein [Bacillus sp. ISL-45]|uniref:hypothetical protein n=1 Tax=Bacillus sp. ISL-45 TaxID=2819128 RepID=UPI001BEA1756|nr:hypothetical protein [Bacillus sp. ISL-45]MBT2639917.1 hypothetical protein [Bacillus sp. ISL-39]
MYIKKACTSPRAEAIRRVQGPKMDWGEVHELDETGRTAPVIANRFRRVLK